MKKPDLARTSLLPKRPAPGSAPRPEPVLTGAALLVKMRPPGLRERLFTRWLARAQRGQIFVYHRSEESLARDVTRDDDLAQLAEVIRRRSTGFFEEVSTCGHVRGSTTGTGQLELLTRREKGETTYFCRKR